MSGSGGYYRYRCKYFWDYNCPNWVYVNNTACANCSSQGRDFESELSSTTAMAYPHEICVPRFGAGGLNYARVEIDEGDSTADMKFEKNMGTQLVGVPTTSAALSDAPTEITAPL